MSIINKLTRRHALTAMGLGGAAMCFHDIFAPAIAAADDLSEPQLFIFAYFAGGWDTLLSLDPRDNTKFRAGGVVPRYEDHPLLNQNQQLEQNPSGLIQPDGSNIVFGPAIGELQNHFEDLCVVRGINMGTLTHEVGRRHFLTGKFPRGLQASGSALPTWIVHDTTGATTLPNLVIDSESYNEGLDPAATGVLINGTQDLSYMMQQIEDGLDPKTTQAIDEYVTQLGCAEQRLDSSGLVTLYQTSKPSADKLASGELFEHFDFTNPSADLQDAIDEFGYNSPDPALEQAILAAQALRHGISQAVTLSPVSGIDHHDGDYTTQHAAAQIQGFNAMARLLDYLEKIDLRKRTTVVMWSEFARTPTMNSRGGRDHHLTNACAVVGPGIQGNQVIGGTRDLDYRFKEVDVQTGEAIDQDGAGRILGPPDLHATVLESMGLSYDHISNQSPVVVDRMLKK